MSSWTRDISSSGSEDCSEECNLVVRAQGGDQVAFEVLYERYNDRICRYLIRMVGNDGVGCELTQETFLKTWEALSGLRAPARFVGWLYRIATNCAYNYQHHARNFHTVPWDVYTGGLEELTVAGPEDQGEETGLLWLALSRVSSQDRPRPIFYAGE